MGTTSFSGLILLIGYMSSDAFTSNWQKELYDTYKISPFQAMCGVNLFSCLLTSVSLLQQGAFLTPSYSCLSFPHLRLIVSFYHFARRLAKYLFTIPSKYSDLWYSQ